MTLSYLTGLVVSGRVTPGAMAVFIAIALYINSKQAFVLWMRRRKENSVRSLAIFMLQVLSATMLLLPVLGKGLASLMPYALVPFAYLICLKFLGEHSIITEISGFVLLTLSALVAKLTATGVIDPALFTAVAVFFTAGVFRVRVQLTKGMSQRILMVIYVVFAIATYLLIHAPVLVLLPLIDNLVFSITLYRLKLRETGWMEVMKGAAFLLLMAINYILIQSTANTSSIDTAPALKNRIFSPEASTMVEGFPPGVFPQSIIRSRASPKYLITSSVLSAGGIPEIFALVAVIGNPSNRARSSANDSPGILTAIFPVFAVMNSEIEDFAGSKRVSGPGQNFLDSFSAETVMFEAMRSSASFCPIMSGSALFQERCLIPYSLWSAEMSSYLAPRP